MSVLIAAVAVLYAAANLHAQDMRSAQAELTSADGERVGQVDLRELSGNTVLMTVDVSGLTPGTHAIHIHETGRCEAPSFESAGGHYAPRGHAHGALHPEGSHAGDLPNLHVPADGDLTTEGYAHQVTLREGLVHTLFDEDGSAIVIHAGSDDYRSQPSGDAGSRVACGVVR